MVQEEARIP